MMSCLGRFVTVKVPQLDDDGATNISTYLHKLVSAVLTRIRDAKRNNSERPIILAGWGVGAAINCQVAAMETVTACICLGFPMFTMEGIRGDADDPILDLKHPVLFVVGQLATLCRPDDVEDMRERMKTDTGLVVVGGADDQLRVSKHKKKAEGLTQSMVDRCIMVRPIFLWVVILRGI